MGWYSKETEQGMEKRRKKKRRARIFTRRMQEKLTIVFLLIVVGLFVTCYRLSSINMKSGDDYTLMVLAQQQYNSKLIPYRRGDITDRNGNVLATSIKVYNMVLDPRVILSNEKFIEPTLNALVECFSFDRQEILQLINENQAKSYLVYKKQLTYEEIESFLNLQNDEKRSQNVKGVWFEEEYKRNYPFSTLACSVLGFTVSGNQGNWGLEEYYNSTLNGSDGREYGYVNEENNMESIIKEAVDGNSIVSTLDFNIQNIVEKHIANYVKEYKPKNVAVVIADPNTGEILAMASDRSYDLNNPANTKNKSLRKAYSKSKIEKMSEQQLASAFSENVWRNYCISDTYEPGSTFKPFTIAAALEENKIQSNAVYECNGHLTVSDRDIGCHNTNGHGNITVEESISESCNVALMKIAQTMGADIFCTYQENFGFGKKSGIDLPGEASCEGLLYTTENMQVSDLATNSFGQNFNVNMVQMVAGFSSLINGGYYYEPHMVKQILNANGGVVKTINKKVVKQTVTKETSEFLKGALRKTVTEGTGKSAGIAGYEIAGKTGTAQKHNKDEDVYVLSFLGYAPQDTPKVVCYALVDEPQVDDPGSSSYASKLFSAIMTEVLPYMDIFPQEKKKDTKPEDTKRDEVVPEEMDYSQ